MTPLAPNLDDLRFQKDLVDEARRRIIRYCPEWTDYNLSDPGITLIELFAFLTESMIYRLNRVPERNYLKFLEMLGVNPLPASSARTELTFYLSAPFPINPGDGLQVVVPVGQAVSTRAGEGEEEITFTVDENVVISEPRLVQLRRADEFNKNYLTRLGIEDFHAFSHVKPKEGDTFYIGFDEEQDLRGYILLLTFDCVENQAVGIRRNDPPLEWAYSLGDGNWQEIAPSTRPGEKDTTGGLDNPHGTLVFHLSRQVQPDVVHGRRATWLRCRLHQRSPDQGMYAATPVIQQIQVHALGAKTVATHAISVLDEVLGVSKGDPGQVLHIQHAPVLALRADEQLQVEEKIEGELGWVPWQRVPDFSMSSHFDRHFTLDEVSGEIRFGPAIRQPDGSMRQYGRVPETGRRVRLSAYRYGGGVSGNVPSDKIQVLRSAIPFIDRVTNFQRAEGGRDQETVDEVVMRSKREMRAQQRAVTPEDFEILARGATREVARVRCPASQSPGVIELLVVPSAAESLRRGDFSRLTLDANLQGRIRAYLDQYRLLSTVINIREPVYLGVKVCVSIAITPFSRAEQVQTRVKDYLQALLSPQLLGPADERLGPNWEGWPFGRDLYISELYAQVQNVPGVKHVLDVKVNYRRLLLGEASARDENRGEELIQLTERSLTVPADTLLCSLEHEVEVVEL